MRSSKKDEPAEQMEATEQPRIDDSVEKTEVTEQLKIDNSNIPTLHLSNGVL